MPYFLAVLILCFCPFKGPPRKQQKKSINMQKIGFPIILSLSKCRNKIHGMQGNHHITPTRVSKSKRYTWLAFFLNSCLYLEALWGMHSETSNQGRCTIVHSYSFHKLLLKIHSSLKSERKNVWNRTFLNLWEICVNPKNVLALKMTHVLMIISLTILYLIKEKTAFFLVGTLSVWKMNFPNNLHALSMRRIF